MLTQLFTYLSLGNRTLDMPCHRKRDLSGPDRPERGDSNDSLFSLAFCVNNRLLSEHRISTSEVVVRRIVTELWNLGTNFFRLRGGEERGNLQTNTTPQSRGTNELCVHVSLPQHTACGVRSNWKVESPKVNVIRRKKEEEVIQSDLQTPQTKEMIEVWPFFYNNIQVMIFSSCHWPEGSCEIACREVAPGRLMHCSE